MGTAGKQGTLVPTEQIDRRRVAHGRLLWAGLLAGVFAAVLTALVYLGASFLEAMPQDVVVQGGRGPITLGAVVFFAFVPALLAAGVFALLGRFTRRPVRNFLVLAAAVLVLSFVPPFTLSGAPPGMILALVLMHVVAAVVITGVLATLASVEG